MVETSANYLVFLQSCVSTICDRIFFYLWGEVCLLLCDFSVCEFFFRNDPSRIGVIFFLVEKTRGFSGRGSEGFKNSKKLPMSSFSDSNLEENFEILTKKSSFFWLGRLARKCCTEEGPCETATPHGRISKIPQQFPFLTQSPSAAYRVMNLRGTGGSAIVVVSLKSITVVEMSLAWLHALELCTQTHNTRVVVSGY